jgi:hypothetical protein
MVLFLIAASPASRQDKIYDTGGDAEVVGEHIELKRAEYAVELFESVSEILPESVSG